MWRGQAGNHSKLLHSSLVEGTQQFKKKREVTNIFCNVIQPYIHVLFLSGGD